MVTRRGGEAKDVERLDVKVWCPPHQQPVEVSLESEYWSTVLCLLTPLEEQVGVLMTSRAALFIVDVQNDWLPPDGKLIVPNGRDIIPIIQDLLDPSKWEWDLVIASQVSSIPLPPQ